jgi:gluconate 2-dehydrogenase subunit 3-like protein
MARFVTRRQVLRWGVAGGAAALLPGRALLGCGGTVPIAPETSDFLTDEEKRILTAITGRIVPTDDKPGAIEADASEYINRLLTLVPTEDEPVGNVFAGGPFSNRNPFPDPKTGTPSNTFPRDEFLNFIPLTRLQLMSWRVQLLGTDAVPGSDFNANVVGKVVGWREQYRTGLASAQALSQSMFGTGFVDLTATQQDAVIAKVSATFRTLVTNHTLEGMFCAPEYGGNSNRVGWQLIQYDGDSQPLGYSIFDETTMSYKERADKPNSTANPDEDFSGFDDITTQFLTKLVKIANPAGPYFPK